jgi:hypothetical protein
MVVGRAGDVPCAAGACARRIDGFVHGGAHGSILAHAEIVVGAPHGHLACAALVEVVCGREVTQQSNCRHRHSAQAAVKRCAITSLATRRFCCRRQQPSAQLKSWPGLLRSRRKLGLAGSNLHFHSTSAKIGDVDRPRVPGRLRAHPHSSKRPASVKYGRFPGSVLAGSFSTSTSRPRLGEWHGSVQRSKKSYFVWCGPRR